MDYSDAYRPSRLMRQLQARYAFLGLLGRGGAGIVFEVENLTLKRREALKLFTQGFARDGSQRFAQEARIMASLEHPHIMPIYSFGEDQGSTWFAMKLVEGPTLALYLRVVKRLDASETIRIAVPLLEALAVTHEHGIVHRDLKPANVLLDPKAGPLLTDFGIAKAESSAMQTETGAFLGTPAYISPEQGIGRHVDGRTDLYALGMVLYEMLAGRLPFDDGNSLAVVLQRFQVEAPSLGTHRPDLPAELVQVVDRALARDPDQRTARAADMRQDLLACAESHGIDLSAPLRLPPDLGPTRQSLPEEWVLLAEQPEPGTTASQPPVAVAEPAEPKPRRGPWAYLLGGVALIGLVATLGWAWQSRGRVPAPTPQAAAPSSGPAPSRPVEAKPKPEPRRSPEPAAEAPRRAVSPAQMLVPPLVDKSESAGCRGQSASVVVQVDESGAVVHARLISDLPPTCREAALKAARATRFQPALAADGKPVSSTLAISIEL